MIIRKTFKFEAAHIVRNCTSKACRENIHGHSYLVEVFIKGNKLDNGCMLLDFAKLGNIKELINSFDHSYCLWQQEDKKVKEAIHLINKRIVTMPISPSAEGFALSFLKLSTDLLNSIDKNNNEGDLVISSVRVHETATGYAEAFTEDIDMASFTFHNFTFSDEIRKEWNILTNFAN